MTIDVQKAKTDLSALVETIRELKHRRGESRQPRWTARDACDLAACKREATLFCCLLAHRRGRLHLRALGTLEKQAERLGDWWRRYELPAAAA